MTSPTMCSAVDKASAGLALLDALRARGARIPAAVMTAEALTRARLDKLTELTECTQHFADAVAALLDAPEPLVENPRVAGLAIGASILSPGRIENWQAVAAQPLADALDHHRDSLVVAWTAAFDSSIGTTDEGPSDSAAPDASLGTDGGQLTTEKGRTDAHG